MTAIKDRLAKATAGPWCPWISAAGASGVRSDSAAHDVCVCSCPDGKAFCTTDGKNNYDPRENSDFIAHAPTDIAALLTEIDRLHTWAGLMSLLAEHYPPEVFTGSSGDIGAQLVVLAREIERLTAERDAMRRNLTPEAALLMVKGLEAQCAETARVAAELDEAKALLAGPVAELIGYAGTVRTDRRDSTREFAMQTVDWCEGLVEHAGRVQKAIEP